MVAVSKSMTKLVRFLTSKGLLAGNSGGQSGGWFRKEMTSPDDFNGLKYRMPGLGGKVLGKLGASVQNIPGGELYQALSSGALDGLEWVGPAADERAGFWEVAKVYYTAGFHEPGSALSANINLDKWNSLSEPHQAIIRYASMATTLYQLAETFSANGAALQRMQSQGLKLCNSLMKYGMRLVRRQLKLWMSIWTMSCSEQLVLVSKLH
jgi:TRAP-type mannitol/chloroaromatic compound transport system substrate-binding protein